MPHPLLHPLIIIPARLASSRLPGKALADIGGRPMIAHVVRRALAAALGPVAVATDDAAIAGAAESAGACSVLTGDHPSGTDRIAAALAVLDPTGRHDPIVNLQGDEPEVAPDALAAVLRPLDDPAVAMATLAAPLLPAEAGDPDAVKVWGTPNGAARLHVAGFSRLMPASPAAPWRHVGLYAWRRAALARFVALPPSPNERRERLEQLRALDSGMRIDATLVDACPRGVDTPADLAAARARLAKGPPP